MSCSWVAPGYDATGNMTFGPKPGAETTADEAHHYVWDAWNRLVEVKDGANVVLKCEYDGLGRRTKKFVNTSDPLDQTYDEFQHFFYNSVWQILETRRSGSENDPPESENPEVQYVWSRRYIDAPVIRDRDSDGDGEAGDGSLGKTNSGLDERLFYVTDANFNVTALVQGTPGDADLGKVVERYACDPYGQVLVLDGADGVDPDTTAGDPDEQWGEDADGASDVANEILFCGYRLDPETSLYHVRHRMYHPTLGRWLQRDPLGYVDGMSLYEYCGTDPLFGRDPLGLGRKLTQLDRAAIAGACRKAAEDLREEADRLEQRAKEESNPGRKGWLRSQAEKNRERAQDLEDAARRLEGGGKGSGSTSTGGGSGEWSNWRQVVGLPEDFGYDWDSTRGYLPSPYHDARLLYGPGAGTYGFETSSQVYSRWEGGGLGSEGHEIMAFAGVYSAPAVGKCLWGSVAKPAGAWAAGKATAAYSTAVAKTGGAIGTAAEAARRTWNSPAGQRLRDTLGPAAREVAHFGRDSKDIAVSGGRWVAEHPSVVEFGAGVTAGFQEGYTGASASPGPETGPYPLGKRIGEIAGTLWGLVAE